MDGQMKKGVLELCVLGALSGRQRYGYEIARAVRARFPEVQESTVYAILRRLRAEESLECEYRSGGGGPTRKYYRLSAAGREALRLRLEAWRQMAAAVEALCAPGTE